MEPIGPADVAASAARIRGHVRHTPVLSLSGDELGLDPDVRVHLKLDLLQPTGSFKVRGAVSAVAATDPAATVLAASGGNFGAAVAHAAARLDRRAVIVVPATSPAAKIDPIRASGAQVVVVEGVYADAFAEVQRRLAADPDAVLLHAYDQPAVVAGQGTAARELVAATPVDAIVVACGGGGLLAGTIAAVDADVRVVAVETVDTPTLHAALEAGEPVDVEVGGLAVSALGAPRIGAHAWAVRERIADSVLVSDAEVAAAQRLLWARTRLITEPGGATALAALLSGRYRPEPGMDVGVLVCGANTDPAAVSASV